MPFPLHVRKRSIGIEWIYAADSPCLILHSTFPLHPSQLALLNSLNFHTFHSSAGNPLFIPDIDSSVHLPNHFSSAAMEAPTQGYRRNVGICLVNDSKKVTPPSMILRRSLPISLYIVLRVCTCNLLNLFVYVCYLHRFLLLRGQIFPVRGKCLR